MWGSWPSPPGEIIRSGKSLSDGRCKSGEGPTGAGGSPCSCTARGLLDQLCPILHLHKAITSTRDPFPTPQGGWGPISPQCPGEASRGVHSRLPSRCRPPLAPCPGLFSSRDTKAQLKAWHITGKHDSPTAADRSQQWDASRRHWSSSPPLHNEAGSPTMS